MWEMEESNQRETKCAQWDLLTGSPEPSQGDDPLLLMEEGELWERPEPVTC